MAKTICLRCHGNGYIKVMDSMENQHQIETIYQCPQCNSQGEVMIDEPRFKNIQKERDLLSVAHIRKLEEEIDMLRKQKIYLQSKLREKGKQDDKL